MKLKYFLIMTLILLFCSLSSHANQNLTKTKFIYHQNTDGNIEVLTHDFTVLESGYKSRIETDDSWSETVLDEHLNTLEYTFNPDTKINTIFKAIRNNEMIVLDRQGLKTNFNFKKEPQQIPLKQS